MSDGEQGKKYETNLPINRKQLRQRWQSGERFEFYLFYGHNQKFQQVDTSCLSQWFERDFSVDGVEYATAEHWMMAEKARLFKDDYMLESILDAAGPKEAKALGRKVRGFSQAMWEQHRFEIVRQGNYAKFIQNEDLKKFLLATAQSQSYDQKMVAEPKATYKFGKQQSSPAGETDSNVILVEAAGRDVIWGIGLGQHNPKAQDPFQWRGHNLLGFALTLVREQLANIQPEEWS